MFRAWAAMPTAASSPPSATEGSGTRDHGRFRPGEVCRLPAVDDTIAQSTRKVNAMHVIDSRLISVPTGVLIVVIVPARSGHAFDGAFPREPEMESVNRWNDRVPVGQCIP